MYKFSNNDLEEILRFTIKEVVPDCNDNERLTQALLNHVKKRIPKKFNLPLLFKND